MIRQGLKTDRFGSVYWPNCALSFACDTPLSLGRFARLKGISNVPNGDNRTIELEWLHEDSNYTSSRDRILGRVYRLFGSALLNQRSLGQTHNEGLA